MKFFSSDDPFFSRGGWETDSEREVGVRGGEVKAEYESPGALHLKRREFEQAKVVGPRGIGVGHPDKNSFKGEKRRSPNAEGKVKRLLDENAKLKRKANALEKENGRLEEMAKELEKAAGSLARRMKCDKIKAQGRIERFQSRAEVLEQALVQAQWRAAKDAANRTTVKMMMEHMRGLLDSSPESVECGPSPGEKLVETPRTSQLFGDGHRKCNDLGCASGGGDPGGKSALRHFSGWGTKVLCPGGRTPGSQRNPSGGSGTVAPERRAVKKKLCFEDHKRASKKSCGGSQRR